MGNAAPMPDAMVWFKLGDHGFGCRAAAVCVHDGRVLLHEAVEGGFWVLPGGRVNLMESAAEAVARELREELDVDAEVERLLWLVETFFELDGRVWHEIGFYFKVNLPDPVAARRDFWGKEGDLRLRYRWFDAGELAQITVYPTFLPEAVGSLPQETRHIVQRR